MNKNTRTLAGFFTFLVAWADQAIAAIKDESPWLPVGYSHKEAGARKARQEFLSALAGGNQIKLDSLKDEPTIWYGDIEHDINITPSPSAWARRQELATATHVERVIMRTGFKTSFALEVQRLRALHEAGRLKVVMSRKGMTREYPVAITIDGEKIADVKVAKSI